MRAEGLGQRTNALMRSALTRSHCLHLPRRSSLRASRRLVLLQAKKQAASSGSDSEDLEMVALEAESDAVRG